jgi:hypothetical protein
MPPAASRNRPRHRPSRSPCLCAKRLVIDSSKLQSVELREFLSASSTNMAVLADFAWFEVYKQQSAGALLAFFSVIGDFAGQLIVLKSGAEIARINPALPIGPEEMTREDSHLVRQMIDTVRGPQIEDPMVLHQLQERWRSANLTLTDMHEGAIDIIASLPEMSEQMFSESEIRIIRTNRRYTEKMFANIFGAAEQIWETLADGYAISWPPMAREHLYDAYLFRYALGIVIYLLWWIRTGSQKVERLDRVRNDLIDLSLAVYGTYFDGFLTGDRRAEWLFQNLSRALEAVR